MNSDFERERKLLSKSIGLVSKKWHSRIVYQLLKDEEATFSQLRDKMDNISNKVLSESLKDLSEAGIVEKLNEGSTRYRLTRKGKELEAVFEELIDWADRYVAERKPVVLIIEDNEQQAEMYSRWLGPGYETRIASRTNQVFENISDDVDVVLLDRMLSDSTAEELLQASNQISEKQVIIITGVEPGPDLIDLDIEHYLIKPVSKQDLLRSVKTVIKASQKTEKVRELMSLMSKKDILDRSSHSLRGSEEYSDLVDRIRRLKQEVDNPEDITDLTD